MAGGEDVNEISTSKAELYNPATGKYTATGNMPSNRQEQVAVLLTQRFCPGSRWKQCHDKHHHSARQLCNLQSRNRQVGGGEHYEQ